MGAYDEPDVRGWFLVLAPLVGIPLLLFLDSPYHYAGPLSVFVLVLVLVASDASARDLEGGHVLLTVLAWPIGYLRYLHARGRDFGPKKLIPGILALLVYFAATAFASGADARLDVECAVNDRMDAECTLTNEGHTLATRCFYLRIVTPGGDAPRMGPTFCAKVWPGTNKKTIAGAFNSIPRWVCEQKSDDIAKNSSKMQKKSDEPKGCLVDAVPLR